MGKEDNTYKKIKESFEQINSSAPENLWDKISGELDSSSLTDNVLDDKIKNSFNSVNKQAPEYIWNNINRQLNIDTVWNRISKVLDRRQLFYKTTKAAVYALFLIMLLWGGYMYRYNLYDNGENFSKNYKDIITEKDVKAKQVKTSGNKKQRNVLSENSKKISRNNQVHPDNSNSESEYETISVNRNNTFLKAETELKQLQADSNNYLPPVIPPVLFSEIKNSGFVFPEIEFPNKGTKYIQRKYKPFSIGFIYQYDNTWLINNETRTAFDKTSLVATNYSLTGSYAVLLNYSISCFSEISTEFYVNDKIIQDYGEYIEGRYSNKKIELTYLKAALLYKQNFSVKINQNKSKFSISAGMYAAKLNTEYRYLDNKIVSTENLYDNFDYGIKINAGKEVDLGQFVFGYGLNTEYGLKNIFTGNNNMKAEFDITKTYKIGAYVSLRYKIF